MTEPWMVRHSLELFRHWRVGQGVRVLLPNAEIPGVFQGVRDGVAHIDGAAVNVRHIVAVCDGDYTGERVKSSRKM